MRRSLLAKENSEKHVKLTLSRIRKIISGCEFKLVGDLKADDVETYLTDMREEDDIGYRNLQSLLAGDRTVGATGMISRRRLDRNPLVGIPPTERGT